MEGGGRQTAESGGDILGSEGAKFGGKFAEQEIGEDGAGSDGGDTTLRLEACCGDALGFHAHG